MQTSDIEKIKEPRKKSHIGKLLEQPDEKILLTELKIEDNLTECFRNENVDIVMGVNKLAAYVPKKNVLILKWDKYGTSTLSRSFRGKLVKDVQSICNPLKLTKVYITKNELNKIANGRPINNIKKVIENLIEGSGLKIQILQNVQVISDPSIRKVILNDYHMLPTSGHAGIKRMLRNIKRKYYWTGIQNDVTTYVKRCEICQKTKHVHKNKQPMIITTTAETSFEKIYLDLVGPLEQTSEGSKYILTIQDELTKFVEAFPLKSKESYVVAQQLVEKFILKYGIPKEICTDQGSEFINKTVVEVCKLLKINQLGATAYHHETIGALENTHKGLNAYLRAYLTQKNSEWDHWLPYYVFSYNTSVHSETNYTPFELVYGKVCKLPSNLSREVQPLYNYEDYVHDLRYKLQTCHRDAKESLIAKKKARKEYFDRKYNAKEVDYKPGSLVLLRNNAGKKLEEIYSGPYEVKMQNGVNCQIKINNKLTTVHKNRLKPFYTLLLEIAG